MDPLEKGSIYVATNQGLKDGIFVIGCAIDKHTMRNSLPYPCEFQFGIRVHNYKKIKDEYLCDPLWIYATKKNGKSFYRAPLRLIRRLFNEIKEDFGAQEYQFGDDESDYGSDADDRQDDDFVVNDRDSEFDDDQTSIVDIDDTDDDEPPPPPPSQKKRRIVIEDDEDEEREQMTKVRFLDKLAGRTLLQQYDAVLNVLYDLDYSVVGDYDQNDLEDMFTILTRTNEEFGIDVEEDRDLVSDLLGQI